MRVVRQLSTRQLNREQQAMIIQHYYVRKYGPATNPDGVTGTVGAAEYTEWQPYANIVHNAQAAAAA